MAQDVYIYALRDPRDGRICYIGKTENPERRLRQHHDCAGRRMLRLIQELAVFGLSLQMQILQRCSGEDWALWERYWIDLGFRLGVNLLNLMPGGQNPPRQTGNAWLGRRHNPETLRKMSAAKIGKHPNNFGKRMPTEVCEKNRTSHLGKTHTLETRRKMSVAHIGLNTWSRGRKCSEEHRAKVSSSVREWWMKRKAIPCR